MKKLKRAVRILFIASVVLMSAFLVYERMTRDSEAPEITCPESVIEASVSVTEQDLLAEVTAQDNRDGDLTGSVVVEKLSVLDETQTRTVHYAVMDSSGNVARATRSLHYTDYEKPRIRLSRPLRFPDRDELFTMLQHLQADSVLDGDLSSRVKYSMLDSVPIGSEGTYPIEFRVTDSAGISTVLQTELEIYSPNQEPVRLELQEYIVYLRVGEAFSAQSFFRDSSEPGELRIESDVDMSKPGIYHVDYTLQGTGENQIGRSRLIVVVEE